MKTVRSALLGVLAMVLSSCAGTSAPDTAAGGTGGIGGGGTSGGAAGGTSGATSGGTGGGGMGGAASGGTSTGGASGAASGGTSTSGASGGGTSGETSGGAGNGGAGGAVSAGTSGGGASGADSGGTGGAGAGGTSGEGAGGTMAGSGGTATGGSGGVTTCGTTPGDVELSTSIPQEFKQPSSEAGRIEKHSYPCYYYTDLTAGQSGDPSDFVLQRRDQPITKEFNIYLPYQYSEDESYPVVYILHGITDNEETWLERGDPHPAVLLDNLIAAGEIRPVIAIFPNGNSSSSFLNRDFSNQAGYYFFANELVNDLIPFVESEWSVASDRNCRALTGFSMGGMQTINAGLCQSLEHIAWFGALSAAPSTYGSTRVAEYVALENPATYPINYFYNVVGASDGTARSSHEAAVQDLNDKSAFITDENFVYHTVPGDHNYPVVSIGLYNFLRISFSN